MLAFARRLKKERDLIRFGIELLEVYRNDLLRDQTVSAADLRMATYAIQSAYEISHILNEERLLYPALLQTCTLPNEIADRMHLRRTDHQETLNAILELRLSIDDFEFDLKKKGLLTCRLTDVIERIQEQPKFEDDKILSFAEKNLRSVTDQKLMSESIDSDRGAYSEHVASEESLKRSRYIFNQLRHAKGLSSAS